MNKNTVNKNIFAALLVTSALAVSGCTASTVAPSAKIETKFQHNIGDDHLKKAITSAAQENGWEVVSSASTSNALVLKKTISVKKTAENTRGRTWNKVMVDKEVFADVTVSGNSYAVDLSKESQKCLSNYYANKSLQTNMKDLQKSIHLALIPEVL